MTADASVIGKVGRVTGRVARGSVGEVMVGPRGGSERPVTREPAKRTEPDQ